MYGYGYSYPNNPQGSGLMGRYEAGVRSDGGSFAFPIDTGLASRLEGLGLLNASSLVNSCNAGKESVLYNLIPTPVQSLDRFAVTRSTVKWVLGQDGVLTSIPANTPAFEYNTDGTYRGLLVEPAGTNSIRNNTNVGAVAGTPGTLPTNWAIALGGLSQSIVGTGTENGVDYIDIRLSGTASGTQANIRFETSTAIVAANGETWTNSCWVRKISEPSPPVNYRLLTIEYTSVGGFVTEGASTISATTTLSRFSFTRTLSGGGTVARVQPAVVFTLVNGATYDFTVRVGLPQMETGSVATSVIKTSGTSLTRTADSVTLTGASSLIGQASGGLYVEFMSMVTGANPGGNAKRAIALSNGTTTARILIQKTTSDQVRLLVTNTTDQADIVTATNQSGLFRVGVRYGANDFALVVNGTVVGTDVSGTVPACSQIDLGGEGAVANSQLNGHLRAAVLFLTPPTNATLQALTA